MRSLVRSECTVDLLCDFIDNRSRGLDIVARNRTLKSIVITAIFVARMPDIALQRFLFAQTYCAISQLRKLYCAYLRPISADLPLTASAKINADRGSSRCSRRYALNLSIQRIAASTPLSLDER